MQFRWKIQENTSTSVTINHSCSSISDMDFLWHYSILPHTGITESTLNKHWQLMIFVAVLGRELSGYMF